MLKIVCAHWDLWWQREVLTSNIALAADWSIGIERWWNDTDGKNRSTLRKPVPLLLGPPRIPHWLVWVRNPGLHIERLVTGQPPETWHKNGQEWRFIVFLSMHSWHCVVSKNRPVRTYITLLALCYSIMFRFANGRLQAVQLIRLHSQINKMCTRCKIQFIEQRVLCYAVGYMWIMCVCWCVGVCVGVRVGVCVC